MFYNIYNIIKLRNTMRTMYAYKTRVLVKQMCDWRLRLSSGDTTPS